MVLEGHGGFEKLVFHQDWPVPQIGQNDVLIKVGACGLNNTDVNTRSGWYSKAVREATTGAAYESVSDNDPTWGGTPITFPRIQGVDAVGEVIALGANVPKHFYGKRVMVDGWMRNWDTNGQGYGVLGYFGSECDGGFAQFTKSDYRNVGIINSNLTDAELATFSCSYTTAEGLLTKAKVTENDSILITGASGGVGSALVQLAKRRKATVIALASTAKHAQIKNLGADIILERNPDDIKTCLKQTLGKDSVSVVADIVAGDQFGNMLDILERGGRYCSSGAIAGPIVELDMRLFYLKDLSLLGSTVTPLNIFPNLIRYIEKEEIKPILAAEYKLKDLHSAQREFIKKQHVGNIVVKP